MYPSSPPSASVGCALLAGTPEAAVELDDPGGTLSVVGGPHGRPLSTGDRCVRLWAADQRAAVRTTGGDIRVQEGSTVRSTSAAEPAVSSDGGAIVLLCATIHGDVQSLAGSILVGQDACVHGDVRHLGPSKPTAQTPAVRIEGGKVSGRVQADSVLMSGASVGDVCLDGRRRGPLGGEARLDLRGANELGTIHGLGPAVVVFHQPRPAQLTLIGEQLRCLYLSPPTTLSSFSIGIDLPEPDAPLTWAHWHELQHGLEYLCAPGLSRFHDRIDPSEWERWTANLARGGRDVATLFRRWIDQEPTMLLTGLQAQGVEGLERSCAGLALALLKPPTRGGSDLPPVLSQIDPLAAQRKSSWRAIRDCMDQLEGIDVLGRPLYLPEASAETRVPPSSRRPVGALPEAFQAFCQRLAESRGNSPYAAQFLTVSTPRPS